MSQSIPDSLYTENDEDEYLTRVVVDEVLLKFYLYSSYGDKKTVECHDTDEFISVRDLIESVVAKSMIVYAEPLTFNQYCRLNPPTT